MSTNKKFTSAEMFRIYEFALHSSGLQIEEDPQNSALKLMQKNDHKELKITSAEVSEVLLRTDSDGKNFLQVNFSNYSKILITENLVGFKPAELVGLDMNKIPKVVTTPDILSVKSAIDECLQLDNHDELEVLKRVYLSIVSGAMKVGFAMDEETTWITSISSLQLKAAA